VRATRIVPANALLPGEAMPYEFDLFISYASEDRVWAEKLYSLLMAKDQKLKIFLDRATLRAGEHWEPQLGKALQSSRHFAVLWSDKAGEPGKWVGPELERFLILREPNANERLLFYIPLQGDRANLKTLQGFPALRELGVYGKDDGELDGETLRKRDSALNRIVTDIVNGVRTDASSDAVPVALFTIGSAEFAEIDRKDRFVALNLDRLLTNLEALQYVQLQSRYMATSRDWRPFGGPHSIIDVLNDALIKINANLVAQTQRPIRWEFRDFENLMAGHDDAAVLKVVSELNSTFSVIVIDPIALYSRRLLRFFKFFDTCLANERTVTITLSATTNPAPYHVNNLIQDLAYPILDAYFLPKAPVKRFLNLGMNIDHDSDIRRLIMTGLVHHRFPRTAAPSNAYTPTQGA
jgi:hypothetical protein